MKNIEGDKMNMRVYDDGIVKGDCIEKMVIMVKDIQQISQI